MKVFHTSPVEITKLNKWGRFGTYLFFALEPYSTYGAPFTYTLEIEDLDIIEAALLFSSQLSADWTKDQRKQLDAIVAETMELTGCGELDAMDLLSEVDNIHDAECAEDIPNEDKGEISWDLQELTARAGTALGYDGVLVRDEQGPSYMINMAGREKDLVLVRDDRASNPGDSHSERVKATLQSRYGAYLENLWITSSGDYGLTLNAIVIRPEHRNLGIGTEVMEDLLEYADEHGLIVTLTPSPDFGGSKARLTKYYKRFGFKPNKGRNKDYRFTETMIRQQRSSNPLNFTDKMRKSTKEDRFHAQVLMDPEVFLDLTTPNGLWKYKIRDEADDLNYYNEKATSFPLLVINAHPDDPESGIVVQHDGRHRAAALLNNGEHEMSVAIKFRDKIGRTSRDLSIADAPTKWIYRQEFDMPGEEPFRIAAQDAFLEILQPDIQGA